MELLHTLEESAPNFLRPTKNVSRIRTEGGLRAAAFFEGEGVRQKLLYLIDFKAYSSFNNGS